MLQRVPERLHQLPGQIAQSVRVWRQRSGQLYNLLNLLSIRLIFAPSCSLDGREGRNALSTRREERCLPGIVCHRSSRL